jgi:hypothetical protein
MPEVRGFLIKHGVRQDMGTLFVSNREKWELW